MKQVFKWPTGLIIIALMSLPGLASAAGLQTLRYESEPLEADEFSQPALSEPLFQPVQLNSSFLLSSSVNDNYTVGINLTELTINHHDNYRQSNSNLLFMLNFKFQ